MDNSARETPRQKGMQSTRGVQSARGDRLRRYRCRGRFGAATLATLLLAAAGIALAQTLTLVSNLSETRLVSASQEILAQSFRTGSDTGGYTLSDVQLTLNGGTSTAVVAVQVKDDNAGAPGNLVASLTDPVANNVQYPEDATFTAPTNTTLAANTTYWVVVNELRPRDNDVLAVYLTDSDSETGETGWTIGDGHLSKPTASDTWTTQTSSLKIAVRGAPLSTNNAPTSADRTVTTLEDTAYAFKTSDFRFSDDDSGDTLSSVTIVTLPASAAGTLALAGVAVSAGDVVPKVDIDNDNLVYTPAANLNGTGAADFTFRVSDGTDESASAYTMTVDVTAVNDLPTSDRGAFAIIGTARVGETLEATVSTLPDDPDGVTLPVLVSLEWFRVDGETETRISGTMGSGISNAATFSYRLAAADEGKTVRLKGEYTDEDGHKNPVTSDVYPRSGVVLPAFSDDATLSALSLGAGVRLSPSFSRTVTEYRARVANGISSVAVTATANDRGATVSIANDNDTSTPGTAVLSLSPGSNTITVTVTPSRGTAATYTVSGARSVPTDVEVTVTGDTAEAGTDFAVVRGFTVTIPAGETQAEETFKLEPVDDDIDEGVGETLTVAGSGTGLTVSPATLTLTDDDQRGLVLPVTPLALDAEGTASYEVALKSQPVGEVTVTPVVTVTPSGAGASVAGASGARATRAQAEATGQAEAADAVTVTPPTLTFTTNDWHVPQTVTVHVALEMLRGDETLAIAHMVSGADYEDLNDTPTEAPEPVVISITAATVALSVDPETVPEGSGSGTVTVTAVLESGARSVPTEVEVTVTGDTAEAETDFAVVPGFTVTIPAGETQAAGTFKLEPVDDDIDEGVGETLTVAGSGTGLAVSAATLTLTDDDQRGLMLSQSEVEVDADGVARWMVELMSQPTEEVTVTVAVTDDPAQVTVTPSSLTFKPSSWNVAQGVTLQVPPGLYAGDDSAAVVHTPTGGDYSPMDRKTVTVALGLDRETMPDAWLARFGRTVAGQAVEMVGSRIEGDGSPHARVGGIGFGNAGTWVEPAHVEDTWTGLDTPLEAERTLTDRDLLLGSSFQWSSGGESGAPAWTAWGRFAHGGFEADEERIRMDGEVNTAFLGMDVAHQQWLAGLAVSLSEGDGEYELLGGDEAGEVESSLSSLFPYGRYRVTDELDVWGMAGYGTGTMSVDFTVGAGETLAARDAGKTGTDIEMQMGAVGALRKVPGQVGGLSIALKTDALWLRMTSKEARDAGGETALERGDAQVRRLRLVVEGTNSFELGGGTLTPMVEVGVRHDGGDAETGTGMEVGGGLRFAGAGFTIEGSARGLLAHNESGFQEWGASGALRVDPDASGRGFSLTVAPAWGAASSEVERLWSLRDTGGLAPEGEFEGEGRLETVLGYGLGGPMGVGLLTPYSGLSLSDGGARTLRLGSRWQVAPEATFGLEATREAGDGEDPIDALMLRGALQW